MNRRALVSVAAVLLSTTLTAQSGAPDARTLRVGVEQKAPGNESITQSDLRADLFFLAGDAMRGRLTDTNENRATADYIRARFERAGLKPASGNSLFHNYNLMTATLGEGNSLSVPLSYSTTSAETARREFKAGQDFYPQRFSASGTATGRIVFAGFGIAAPQWNHNDYRDGVRGNIVLVLDHEPGERDAKSAFEGVVTAEPAAAWRKALAAQEAGAIGILFVSDVHNHPEPANFEQAARNFWPATPSRIPNYTLATWADRIRIPAMQISPAVAASLIAGFAVVARRAGEAGRDGRWHGAGRARDARSRCAPPSIATSFPIATCLACSKAAIRN